MFHISMKVNATNVHKDFDIFLTWKTVFLYYFKYDYLDLVISSQLSMNDDEYSHTFTKRRYGCVHTGVLIDFPVSRLLIRDIHTLSFLVFCIETLCTNYFKYEHLFRHLCAKHYPMNQV